MIVRVSMPSWCSAAAWSSACSTTAPQKDHEYGTTIPTFTGGEDMGTPTLRHVIGRLLAAALAIGLVVLAAAVESDTARLSAKRTETQIAKRYGPDTKASCKEKHGYWDYKCRVQGSSGTFSVEVRVDEHKIVDDSGG